MGHNDALPLCRKQRPAGKSAAAMRPLAALLAAFALPAAAAAQQGGAYSLRPPDLAVPAGAAGAVRRVVMQFYHWTLLCDETPAEKKRVCNVTQTARDARGRTVFSWSLAGSDDGRPFLLLRALPQADERTPFRLTVKGAGETVEAPFAGCNAALCMGQAAVGPVLAAAITAEAEIEMRYLLRDGSAVELVLPLRGLAAAVAAIN